MKLVFDRYFILNYYLIAEQNNRVKIFEKEEKKNKEIKKNESCFVCI